MTAEMTTAIRTALLNDEDFAKELVACVTAVDLADVLDRAGISCTAADIDEIIGEANTAMDGEMTEDMLEQVSGGFVITTGYLITCAVLGAAAGVAGGYGLAKIAKFLNL